MVNLGEFGYNNNFEENVSHSGNFFAKAIAKLEGRGSMVADYLKHLNSMQSQALDGAINAAGENSDKLGSLWDDELEDIKEDLIELSACADEVAAGRVAKKIAAKMQ